MLTAAAIPVIEALVAAAAREAPSLVQAGQTIISLVKQGRDPTPAEQAELDAALAAADAALPSA